MGNLKFEREDDRMVKVMNCEEYDEWREPQVQFLRKRDKYQFWGGLSVFILGAVITLIAVPECVESVFLGLLVAVSGAAVMLTSRLCMKV